MATGKTNRSPTRGATKTNPAMAIPKTPKRKTLKFTVKVSLSPDQQDLFAEHYGEQPNKDLVQQEAVDAFLGQFAD